MITKLAFFKKLHPPSIQSSLSGPTLAKKLVFNNLVHNFTLPFFTIEYMLQTFYFSIAFGEYHLNNKYITQLFLLSLQYHTVPPVENERRFLRNGLIDLAEILHAQISARCSTFLMKKIFCIITFCDK